MGAYWKHEVRIEAILDADPKKPYPVCTGGAGACPPEECGGPEGYLARLDEATGYDAWEDMGVMTEWLDGVLRGDIADKTVRDLLSEDVETAMERVIAKAVECHWHRDW
jgi:hypothetical protein